MIKVHANLTPSFYYMYLYSLRLHVYSVTHTCDFFFPCGTFFQLLEASLQRPHHTLPQKIHGAHQAVGYLFAQLSEDHLLDLMDTLLGRLCIRDLQGITDTH